MDGQILGNVHLSITNIGLYLILSSIIFILLNLLATNNNKIVSNSWSTAMESMYSSILSIVVNQINGKGGQAYFPLIFTLFILIATNIKENI